MTELYSLFVILHENRNRKIMEESRGCGEVKKQCDHQKRWKAVKQRVRVFYSTEEMAGVYTFL